METRAFHDLFELREDFGVTVRVPLILRSTQFLVGQGISRGFRFGGLYVTEHLGERAEVRAREDGWTEFINFIPPPEGRDAAQAEALMHHPFVRRFLVEKNTGAALTVVDQRKAHRGELNFTFADKTEGQLTFGRADIAVFHGLRERLCSGA